MLHYATDASAGIDLRACTELEKKAKQEIMILNNKIVSLQRSNSKRTGHLVPMKK